MPVRRPIHEAILSHDGKSPDTVHTRIELFYRDFLEEIDLSPRDEVVLAEAHVKTVIWGVLYIEALVNYKLYQITQAQLKNRKLAPHYWELTKKARLEDKIDLVLAYGSSRKISVEPFLKGVLRMVELRNRLVHFKDPPTKFDFSKVREKVATNAPLEDWFKHFPNPKIVDELMSVPLSTRRQAFIGLGDVLESIRVAGV